MIYTIGHAVNDWNAIAANGTITKTGRITNADGQHYQGGIACQTYNDALEAINEIFDPAYEVFGLKADWDTDTVPSEVHRWHDLLVSSEIVPLGIGRIANL